MTGTRRARVRTLISLVAVLSAVLASTTAAQAVEGADEGANTGYRFVARLQAGAQPGQACSGVLVAPQWILSEKSCFAVDGRLPVTGAPAIATTASVGTDLGAAGTRTAPVTWLVVNPDREVVLARLNVRVTGVTPARIATTPPQTGDELRVLGFGRTHAEWVPDRLHGATATTAGVAAATIALTAADAGAVCKGDAGGPAVRTAGDSVEVVGLHHASGQLGCDGTTGGTSDLVETRVDDLGSWIAANTHPTCNATVGGVANEGGVGAILPDFTGDCASDIINQNVAGELHGWAGSGRLTADSPLFPGNRPLVGTGWTATQIPRILLGDFTGDGKSDLLRLAADGRLLASASTGDYSADNRLFPTTRLVGTGFSTSGVPRLLAADFNGDGLTDIAGGRADGSLTVWASTGNLSADRLLLGPNTEQALPLTSAAYPRLFASDVDGDGRADVVAQSTDGSLWAYRSLGDLSDKNRLFAPRVLVGSGWTAANIPRIITGDFNSDGRGDIAAQRANGSLSVWTSTGNLAVSGSLYAVAGLSTTAGFTVAAYPRLLIGDLDADGRTDILADNAAGVLFGWPATGDTSPTGRMFPASTGRELGSGWTVAAYPRVF
jgi:Trypsin/FG-GAP-like repeat